jgi:hypothetical protein
MKPRRILLSAFLIALCALVGSVSIFAQSAGTAGLTGTVTDASGAVVPNVTVTVTNPATNLTRTATTGADGTYRFSLLPPGTYRVRFAATGFKTSEVGSVVLDVTETPVLSRALEVGQQTESVTVEATAESLQTATSSLGTTIGARAVVELPLSSRNFTQIIGLSTGASAGAGNATSFGKGTIDMAVNGNNPGQNNFQMDGVAINNIANGGSSNDGGIYGGIGIPSPDALLEFKIQTSTYDASYGRNPGANVNVVTKSGTNSWHGTAFEFFRNAQLNANGFFYNRDNPNSQTQKQVLNQNQFGGVLGGPIKKDKLFIFGSYQGTRAKNGVASQGNSSGVNLPGIPDGDRTTNAFVQGVIASNCNAPGLVFGNFAFPLSCSATTIAPQALKILQLKNADGSYYIPSTGGVPKTTNYSIPAIAQEDQVIVNGDYVINSKNQLAMRYFYSRAPRTINLIGLAGGALPGMQDFTYNSNSNAILKLTTIATSTFLNEARISFQRNLATENESQVPGSSPQALGITPLVSSYTTPPPLTFLFNNMAIFGTLAPSYSPTNQFQIADQISWTHGRHTIRAGFEVERTQWNLVFGGLGQGWMFLGSFSNLLAADQPGNLLFCLFCVRGGPNGIIHGYRLPNMNSFFQDDWKVSSKLTVNLGVRWEYNGTLSDKYGNLTNTWTSKLVPNSQLPNGPNGVAGNYAGYVVPNNFDTRPLGSGGWGAPPAGVFQSDNQFPAREHPPLSNFGPRVGFAYQATDKLVIRGGAGLFYDRVGMDRFVHSVQEGNPYAATVALGPTATIGNPYPATPTIGSFGQRYADFNTGANSLLNHPFMYEVLHTPLVRQYNLNLQYQLPARTVLEVGYVGSNGINLTDYNHNYNSALIATAATPINGITTTTAANAALRTPYAGFATNGLQGTAYDGISSYNSFQFTVRKQMTHGVSIQGAYTYSKGLSNIYDTTANSNDANNLAQQYGPTNFNRPQRLVVNYSWDLPFGKHMGVLGKLTEGWNISGVTTVQNGVGLTLINATGGSAFNAPGTTIQNGYSRAQLAPGATVDLLTAGDIKSRLNSYIDLSQLGVMPAITPSGALTNAAACPTCATLYGNAGVGIIPGPGQFNWDMSVLKTTKITEGQSLQFRAEFFNMFNHTQFSNPGSSGTAVSLVDVTNVTSRNIHDTSVNPRVIQFGLKYIF